MGASLFGGRRLTGLRQQLDAASDEVRALRSRLDAVSSEIAGLRSELDAAKSKAASLDQDKTAAEREMMVQWRRAELWRQDFLFSNRMLIDELDRASIRILAAAEPDPDAESANPEVSIVMPVWNRANLVGTAIRSVLAQSFTNWELIVIDDGSEDDIEGALRPMLRDPRIRFVRRAKGGECAARNHGLSLARGEVIAYLDSDNFWYPDFLEAAVRTFRADPDLDIAYGAISYEWPNGQVRFYQLPFDRAQLLVDNVADINVIVHRRRAYQRYGGFDEQLTRAIEWDLLLRYTTDRPAAHIPAIGARYRILDNERVSQSWPLAPSLFYIRRKWWPRPANSPRILYVTPDSARMNVNQLSSELACMRRFGAEVSAWTASYSHSSLLDDLTFYAGSLVNAIHAFRPDVVHVHHLALIGANSTVLAESGLPVTASGNDLGANPDALHAAMQIPNLRRIFLLSENASGESGNPRVRTVKQWFDSSLFTPEAHKDRRLVLHAARTLSRNNLQFMLDLAKLIPEYRVVVAVAITNGDSAEVKGLLEHRTSADSPAELLFDASRAQIARLMGAAAIYVHSSISPSGDQEALSSPISIAEAMATGAYVLVASEPHLLSYVADAGTGYTKIEQAADAIRATQTWSDAEWRAAYTRSVERAYSHHVDELVLRPIFDEWCSAIQERAMRLASAL